MNFPFHILFNKLNSLYTKLKPHKANYYEKTNFNPNSCFISDLLCF